MRFDNSGLYWADTGRPDSALLPYPRVIWGLLLCLLIAAFLATAGAAQGGEVKSFAVTIADRKVAEGGPTIRVTQGDQVVIVWHSDEIGELHLHGYDVAIHVKPGEATETKLEAQVAGRFPITSHGFGGESHGHDERALLYLEIYPE